MTSENEIRYGYLTSLTSPNFYSVQHLLPQQQSSPPSSQYYQPLPKPPPANSYSNYYSQPPTYNQQPEVLPPSTYYPQQQRNPPIHPDQHHQYSHQQPPFQPYSYPLQSPHTQSQYNHHYNPQNPFPPPSNPPSYTTLPPPPSPSPYYQQYEQPPNTYCAFPFYNQEQYYQQPHQNPPIPLYQNQTYTSPVLHSNLCPPFPQQTNNPHPKHESQNPFPSSFYQQPNQFMEHQEYQPYILGEISNQRGATFFHNTNSLIKVPGEEMDIVKEVIAQEKTDYVHDLEFQKSAFQVFDEIIGYNECKNASTDLMTSIVEGDDQLLKHNFWLDERFCKGREQFQIPPASCLIRGQEGTTEDVEKGKLIDDDTHNYKPLNRSHDFVLQPCDELTTSKLGNEKEIPEGVGAILLQPDNSIMKLNSVRSRRMLEEKLAKLLRLGVNSSRGYAREDIIFELLEKGGFTSIMLLPYGRPVTVLEDSSQMVSSEISWDPEGCLSNKNGAGKSRSDGRK